MDINITHYPHHLNEHLQVRLNPQNCKLYIYNTQTGECSNEYPSLIELYVSSFLKIIRGNTL